MIRSCRTCSLSLACLSIAIAIVSARHDSSRAADAAKAPIGPPPAAVLDAKSWTVPEIKGNTFTAGETFGKPSIAATGKSLYFVTPEKLGPDQKITIQFRFTDLAARSGLALSVGLADTANLKDR